MNQQTLNRHPENILASADAASISIVCGWTVRIPKDAAIKYAKTFGQDSTSGFYPQHRKVILRHQDSFFTFDESQAAAIKQLIQSAYPDAF